MRNKSLFITGGDSDKQVDFRALAAVADAVSSTLVMRNSRKGTLVAIYGQLLDKRTALNLPVFKIEEHMSRLFYKDEW